MTDPIASGSWFRRRKGHADLLRWDRTRGLSSPQNQPLGAVLAAVPGMLKRSQFDELARTRGGVCISMYLPTHRRGPETREDPIRLGNLLREAEDRGAAAGFDKRAVAATLEPVRGLLDDEEFWQHQSEGLALFARDGSLKRFQLPEQVGELVVVADRFCVRPLLPHRDAGNSFYLLALSQNRVRMFECGRGSIDEIGSKEIPGSLREALGREWERKSLQHHTGAARGSGAADTVFHGQGHSVDAAEDELRRFLHVVDAGVTTLVNARDPNAPLVLATVGYVDALYRRISDHPRILKGFIEGNPDEDAPQDLHGKALPIVDPFLSQQAGEQLSRLASLIHTENATDELGTTLTAARDGRVDTLIVASDQPVWGSFDPESGAVEVHGEREPGDADLVDLAVASSVATGAEVLGWPGGAGEHGAGSPVGAILRYGI